MVDRTSVAWGRRRMINGTCLRFFFFWHAQTKEREVLCDYIKLALTGYVLDRWIEITLSLPLPHIKSILNAKLSSHNNLLFFIHSFIIMTSSDPVFSTPLTRLFKINHPVMLAGLVLTTGYQPLYPILNIKSTVWTWLLVQSSLQQSPTQVRIRQIYQYVRILIFIFDLKVVLEWSVDFDKAQSSFAIPLLKSSHIWRIRTHLLVSIFLFLKWVVVPVKPMCVLFLKIHFNNPWHASLLGSERLHWRSIAWAHRRDHWGSCFLVRVCSWCPP